MPNPCIGPALNYPVVSKDEVPVATRGNEAMAQNEIARANNARSDPATAPATRRTQDRPLGRGWPPTRRQLRKG